MHSGMGHGSERCGGGGGGWGGRLDIRSPSSCTLGTQVSQEEGPTEVGAMRMGQSHYL